MNKLMNKPKLPQMSVSQMNKPRLPQMSASQPMHTSPSPRPVATAAVTHDDIARRAYEIYVEKGCLQGQSEQNWLQAEQEQKNRNAATNLLKK